MLNIGLILGLLRDGPVSRDEIKQQAELQNAYDGKNMSTYFAREKDDFIKRTNRGSSKWTVKLTVHGKSEAHELLKQIGENNE